VADENKVDGVLLYVYNLSQASRTVAAHTGLPLFGRSDVRQHSPNDPEVNLILVVDQEKMVLQIRQVVNSVMSRGYRVVALVAWRLGGSALRKLSTLKIPMYVGLPDRAELLALIADKRTVSSETSSEFARQALFEQFFADEANRLVGSATTPGGPE